jgi:hypothetical protein
VVVCDDVQQETERRMPKKIGGNVYWIENGQRTIRVVDAEAAFTNADQARAQVLFAESCADRSQIKLARAAFRQFQGMRYRGENKAAPKKSPKAKSTGKTGGRKPSKKRA